MTNTQYDRFVQAHPYGDFLQLTDWAIIKEPLWSMKQIVISDDSGINASVQVLFRKIPVVGQTLAYISRGPVLDWKNEKQIEEMLRRIIVVCKKESAIRIIMTPGLVRGVNDSILSLMKKYGFIHQGYHLGKYVGQPRYVMITDISLPNEEILKKFSRSYRTAIHKANREEMLSVEFGRETLVDDFVNLIKQTEQRQHISLRSKAYFSRIVQTTRYAEIGICYLDRLAYMDNISNKLSDVTLAEKKRNLLEKEFAYLEIQDRDKIPIGGVLNVYCGSKAYYLYGGTQTELSISGTAFLHFESMKQAQKKGCTTYDFGGVSGYMTPHEDDPQPGLYEFKKRFGSYRVEYEGDFVKDLHPVQAFLFDQVMSFRERYFKLKSKFVKENREKE